jgi:hypothetical protein
VSWQLSSKDDASDSGVEKRSQRSRSSSLSNVRPGHCDDQGMSMTRPRLIVTILATISCALLACPPAARSLPPEFPDVDGYPAVDVAQYQGR